MTPQFDLGIDQPFTENEGSSVVVPDKAASVVVPDKAAMKKNIEARPKRMKQKSKKLMSPYTAIKYGNRGKAVKVKRDPVPP
ncbi:hypothetical protein LINPERHAP1_LOCUS36746, partial [Linum perenne]